MECYRLQMRGKRPGATAGRVIRRVVQRRRSMSRRVGLLGIRNKTRRELAAAYGTTGGKFRELQALVPGGERLRADQLFLRTADYIMHLRLQVHVLRVLSELSAL